MDTFIILAQSGNPFAQFAVDWPPLVANLIAFVVIVVILRVFAFGPIQKMLDARRERIAEGEHMREESERELSEVESTKKKILTEAGQEGQKRIDDAKQAALKLIEDKEQEASRKADDIIAKSREAMAIEERKAQEDLKAQFGRLVLQATSKVAGKMLDENDQRRINQDLIDRL